jgi:hypothetical protein
MSDEWSDLSAVWRSESPDAGDIEARVRRDVARVRITVAVEWFAGASVVVFWAWQGIRHPTLLNTVMGLGSTTFVVVWLIVLHRTIRPPRAASTTTAYLEGALEQARAEVRWFGFVRRSIIALCLFLVPCLAWLFEVSRALYAAEPWRAVLGFGGFAVLVSWLWWIAGQRRARAAGIAGQLIAALQRLAADPGT